VRGRFRIAAVAVRLGVILLLVGCRFEVKDVGGLQAYASDASCVRLRAIEMRSQFPDPASADYLRVRALYSEAMAQANAFVGSVRADVDIRNAAVDVPKSRYDQHQASVRLLEFMEETGRLRAEYFSRLGRELGKALEAAATDAVDQAEADEKAAAGRLEGQKNLQGRFAELQQEYGNLEKAFEGLKATGLKQGTIVAEEYTARVVPEDFVPRVEKVMEGAGAFGGKALDLLTELRQDLKGRDDEAQKRARQRIEASAAILQAAADIAKHAAEPVPDSSGLMMQGTRVAVPLITAIVELDGDISRDGVARFDGIMERMLLPEFDKLSRGSGDTPVK
jgi:hypothetical protein